MCIYRMQMKEKSNDFYMYESVSVSIKIASTLIVFSKIGGGTSTCKWIIILQKSSGIVHNKIFVFKTHKIKNAKK